MVNIPRNTLCRLLPQAKSFVNENRDSLTTSGLSPDGLLVFLNTIGQAMDVPLLLVPEVLSKTGVMVYAQLLEKARCASMADPVGSPEGEWLIPTSLAKIANRLGNVASKKAKSILKPYGLRRHGANRQLWTVRLDRMSPNMRARLEAGPTKAY